MKLTLFHTPRSRSVRPLWLLEEMGLPYTLETIPYNAEYFASEEYGEINPLGKVPALYDGHQLIVESTVIMEYLLTKYGPSPLSVAPEDDEYATYLQWLHMSESGITHYVAVLIGHRIMGGKKTISQSLEDHVVSQVDKAFAMAEATIGDRPYLLKHGFSAADISLGYTLYLAKIAQDGQLPNALNSYLLHLQQRPAWQRVVDLST